jgi:hypothetical protein
MNIRTNLVKLHVLHVRPVIHAHLILEPLLYVQMGNILHLVQGCVLLARKASSALIQRAFPSPAYLIKNIKILKVKQLATLVLQALNA